MNVAGQRRPAFAANEEYYAYVAHGYDLISGSYDHVEAQNAVGRRIRRHMQDVLFHTFRPGHRVLEIGCGTGIEALALAERGVAVVATDLSSDMVAQVRGKAAERGLANVATRQLAAHEIETLAGEFGSNSFDGAYSHGGVLNMEPALPDVAAALAKLLQPSAHFISTVVNQASLFEVIVYPLAFRPRKAFRRLGNQIPIPITRLEAHKRYVVPTRFYSPRAFLSVFHPHFALRHLKGLEIFLPPWNLSDYVDRLAPVARAVEALEDRIADRRPFNAWGSLFLMDLERVVV